MGDFNKKESTSLDFTGLKIPRDYNIVKEVSPILVAVKGVVQGNTVVIKDEDTRDYDGAEVIVTMLNYPQKKDKKAPVDWDSFTAPSERGQHVDEYMKEMREKADY